MLLNFSHAMKQVKLSVPDGGRLKAEEFTDPNETAWISYSTTGTKRAHFFSTGVSGYPRRNRNSNPGRAKLSLFRYLFILLSSQTLAAIFFSRLLFSSLRYSEIRSWRSGSFNVATYVKRSSRKGLASLFLDRQSKAS